MNETFLNSGKPKKSYVWRMRFGYGFVESGRFLADFVINLYLMFFLTDTLKLPVAAVGVMFLACKIVDAFVDYITGVLVDRTHTRFGRSRPWVFAGSFFLSIGLVLVFISPDVSNMGKIIYVYCAYLFYSIGMSFMNISEFAMLPAITADSVERTMLATSRQVFGNIINLVGAFVCAFLLSHLGSSDATVGYLRTAMVMAVAVFTFITVGNLLIREDNLPKVNPNKTGKKQSMNVVKDFFTILTNKRYMQYGVMAALISFAFMTTLTSAAYFFQHVVGNMMLLGTCMSVFSVAQFIGMFLCPVLNKKLSKRNMIMGGILTAIVGYALLFFGHSFNILLFAGYFFIGLGFAFAFTMYFAMMPDVFDYMEYETGKQMAGVVGAVTQYLNKIGFALTSFVIASVLTVGGYDANAKVQSASAKFAATANISLVPVAATLIALVFLVFFDLDKIYPTVRAELDKRHALKSAEEKKDAKLCIDVEMATE